MATLAYTPVTSNTLLPFGTNVLYRNDDSYSSAIDITSIFEDGIEIGNQTFTTLYVNNNGNVTFGSPLSTYTPGVIGGSTGLNIIAPYWADVDTRADVPNVNDGVFWDFKDTRDSVVITWNRVGYYSQHIDKLDTFQLELRDRGAGNVEIIFRYSSVNWTTGDASGGTDGLGGVVARAGFTLGGTYFELPSSGSQSNMLNLEATAGNLGVTGVWQFLLRDGTPSGFGTTGPDSYIGTPGRDVWFGLGGNDLAYGRGTGDILYGNAGADRLYGEGGADRLYGDAGNDRLFGGTERDLLNGGAGSDLMNGGAGLDRAEFQTAAGQNMTVRLGAGTATGQGTDTLVSIESVTTGSGRDLIVGTGGANTLIANAGIDRLIGNGGNDRLDGGRGNDVLTGGSGADRFVFAGNWGTDTITDFQNGLDHIEIETGSSGQAQLSIVDAGADVRVSFLNTVILIKNVAHTAIEASDFIFV
jgi:Ca2+-binding RTX toxin-like protein